MTFELDYHKFLSSLVLIGIGGVICILGGSVTVVTIIYPTVTLVIDAFSLPILESIPLILGSFLGVVSSLLGFYYFYLFKKDQEILSIEIKRIRIILAITFILLIIGLGATMLDVIHAIIISGDSVVNNRIEIGLGLYIIIIGIIIFTVGMIQYFKHSRYIINPTKDDYKPEKKTL